MKNYYNLLGINQDASIEQIEQAYKSLAMKFHPDKNNNDPYFSSLFQQINEAKKLLTDPGERAEYDISLANYDDAYDFFIHHKHEEQSQKKQRKQLRKSKSKNKIYWIAGAVIFLLVTVAIVFNQWGKNEFLASKSNDVSFEEVVTDTLQNDKQVKEEKEVIENSPKFVSKVEAPETETLPEKKVKPFTKVVVNNENKEFSNQQLSEILNRINEAKDRMNITANCITLNKTTNSNIDKDFKIARYLRAKGFTISGRGTVSQNLKGVNIDENGPCLNLIIGSF